MKSLALRAALLAGIGMVALTVPAAAATAVSDVTATQTRSADPTAIQLAQANATRAASEARGGDYKAKKPKKKKKGKKGKKGM
jgi:hypothetical protein